MERKKLETTIVSKYIYKGKNRLGEYSAYLEGEESQFCNLLTKKCCAAKRVHCLGEVADLQVPLIDVKTDCVTCTNIS